MNPLLLYVHIPYCIVKCPYCDFNSYSIKSDNPKQSFDEARYVNAIISEFKQQSIRYDLQKRTLVSVFFGGGTPSLFTPHSFERMLEAFNSITPLSTKTEITIEANPGTLGEPMDVEKLRGYRAAGINRISLGAQSFHQNKLLTLGRIHRVEDTLQAVTHVTAAGFLQYNLDLIFGVIGDTLESWHQELDTALSLAPTHISAYALTIETGTPFHQQTLHGKSLCVDEETGATLYLSTMERLASAGYEQYELSNYATPGNACKHNQGYWNNIPYVGLGAGAHSYFGNESTSRDNFGSRWSNTPAPLRYMELIETTASARQREETLSIQEAHDEFFYLGLRTNQGVSEQAYRERFGMSFSEKTVASLQFLKEEGLITDKNKQYQLTTKGKLLTNSILEELLW